MDGSKKRALKITGLVVLIALVAVLSVPLLLGAGMFTLIGSTYCAKGIDNRHRLNETFVPKFTKINNEMGGVFKIDSMEMEPDFTHNYSLSFTGEKDAFVDSCVEFFTKFGDMDYFDGEYTIKPDFYIRVYCDGKYINYSKKPLYRDSNSTEWFQIRTTYYLDDYSVFESMPGIYQCYFVEKGFTIEQLRHIESTKDNYSFEVIITKYDY